MVKKAEELSKKHGWFLPRQFENEANPCVFVLIFGSNLENYEFKLFQNISRYHANTTGPEILSDFASLPLDYYVTGYGNKYLMIDYIFIFFLAILKEFNFDKYKRNWWYVDGSRKND